MSVWGRQVETPLPALVGEQFKGAASRSWGACRRGCRIIGIESCEQTRPNELSRLAEPKSSSGRVRVLRTTSRRTSKRSVDLWPALTLADDRLGYWCSDSRSGKLTSMGEPHDAPQEDSQGGKRPAYAPAEVPVRERRPEPSGGKRNHSYPPGYLEELREEWPE